MDVPWQLLYGWFRFSGQDRQIRAGSYELERGVTVIPDILCNAGGVVVSYFEWLQNRQNYYWSRDDVLKKLFEVLGRAKDAVEAQKRKFKFSRRLAALTVGIARVADAKQRRGLFP